MQTFMLENLKTLRLSGRCFEAQTDLQCFRKKQSRISIIYGKNGSGKSTLSLSAAGNQPDLKCDYLDANGRSINVPANTVHVFNEEFIKTNVEFQADGLEAVVLIGKQVDIDSQIQVLEKELDEIKNDFEEEKTRRQKLKNKKDDSSPNFWFDKLRTRLQEENDWVYREDKIGRKKTRTNVSAFAIENIFNAPFTTESRNAAFQEYERIFQIISNSNAGAITTAFKTIDVSPDFFSIIDKLLSQKIENPQLSERDCRIIDILAQRGADHLTDVKSVFSSNETDYCPFCFRNIGETEKSDIINMVENALSEEAKDHENQLRKYFQQIKSIEDRIDKLIDAGSDLKTIYQLEYEQLESSVKVISSILSEYLQKLQDKINSIYTPVKAPYYDIPITLDALNEAIEILEKRRIEYNIGIEQIGESKQRASLLNAEIAHRDHQDLYNSWCNAKQALNNCEERCGRLERSIETKIRKIEELNQQKRSVAIAKDVINKALSYIFFTADRLQLEAKNGKYCLISSGHKVKPEQVSTGERNIIALCYFFTQILNNHNEDDNFKDEQLIIIDDPVSSFDIENKVGVITYLKYQISQILNGNDKSKVILLSHDLSTIFDFSKAADEMVDDSGFETFEFANLKLRSFSKSGEYTTLLKELYKYAAGNDSLINDYSVGNCMRRVLEAYGTFLYRLGIEKLTTNEEILALCQNRRQFFENYMYRLVLNGESHLKGQVDSLSDMNFFCGITNDQKKDTAQKIICFLYLINPQHLKQHLSDKGNSLGDFESVINRWLSQIPTDNTT